MKLNILLDLDRESIPSDSQVNKALFKQLDSGDRETLIRRIIFAVPRVWHRHLINAQIDLEGPGYCSCSLCFSTGSGPRENNSPNALHAARTKRESLSPADRVQALAEILTVDHNFAVDKESALHAVSNCTREISSVFVRDLLVDDTFETLDYDSIIEPLQKLAMSAIELNDKVRKRAFSAFAKLLAGESTLMADRTLSLCFKIGSYDR